MTRTLSSVQHRLALSLALLIVCAAVLASCGTAVARCSPGDVLHDRKKGPWLLRVPESAIPSTAERMRFQQLNTYLVPYLLRYANYRRALKAGYLAPFLFTRAHTPAGTLVVFSLPMVPRATLDLAPPELLYYRHTRGGFRLVGGGYRLLVTHASDLNAAMPASLAKWHRIEFACSAPPGRDFLATFALRGRTLDWSWPGVDKYDPNSAIPVWPWRQE